MQNISGLVVCWVNGGAQLGEKGGETFNLSCCLNTAALQTPADGGEVSQQRPVIQEKAPTRDQHARCSCSGSASA